MVTEIKLQDLSSLLNNSTSTNSSAQAASTTSTATNTSTSSSTGGVPVDNQALFNFPQVGSALTTDHALYSMVNNMFGLTAKYLNPLTNFSQPLSQTLNWGNNPFYTVDSTDPTAPYATTGYYTGTTLPGYLGNTSTTGTTSGNSGFSGIFLAMLIAMINRLMQGGTDTTIDDGASGAWGDPHYNFKDSSGSNVTIDHKGVDGQTYNVLNADGLDIDAEYKKYTDTSPQVMGAIRVQSGDQSLVMHDGKVSLNGQDLNVGKTTLKDGRNVEVKENGTVIIQSKDGKGSIELTCVDNGQYYNVDPSGSLKINNSKDSGGVLGSLIVDGQNKTRAEILDLYDTNKNGILDDEDDGLAKKFRATNDIGYFN